MSGFHKLIFLIGYETRGFAKGLRKGGSKGASKGRFELLHVFLLFLKVGPIGFKHGARSVAGSL